LNASVTWPNSSRLRTGSGSAIWSATCAGVSEPDRAGSRSRLTACGRPNWATDSAPWRSSRSERAIERATSQANRMASSSMASSRLVSRKTWRCTSSRSSVACFTIASSRVVSTERKSLLYPIIAVSHWSRLNGMAVRFRPLSALSCLV
jgi:hypothetical protein